MQNGIHHFEPQVASIFNHLYANSEFKTPLAISREVQKLLHVGIYLERQVNPLSPAFSFSPGEKRQLLSGDKAASRAFSKYIDSVFRKMAASTKIYSESDGCQLSDFDLVFTCAQLDGLWLSDPSRDVFGDTVELFRSYWSKTHGGQFFTDAQVTKLAIILLQFDPDAGDDLVDICSGTGGFLLAGANHLIANGKNGHKPRPIGDVLIGQEIDSNVAEVGNTALSARIGKPVAVIQKGDSLLIGNDHKRNGSHIQLGKHSCAATNPPFGTKITIKDPNTLAYFEVARAAGGGKWLKPCPPDVLFTEQNLRLLKPGGRLAIVLPFQLLSGPQSLWFRTWLMSKARIRAVIDLPSETFQPYTGTKASLVLLHNVPASKKKSGDMVFMACPRWIGHDRRGNPTYTHKPDGSSTDQILTDFPDVGRAYSEFLKGKDPAETCDVTFTIEERVLLESHDFRFDARFHKPGANAIGGSALDPGRSMRKTEKLRNLVERIFYPGRFKRRYVEKHPGAIPFLGGTNISQLLVVTDKWLSPQDPHLEQLQVKKDWLLITRSGSTGIVSSVPEAWENFAISEHVIRIVPKAGGLPGEYLFAFLRCDSAQEIIQRGIYGSVIDEINPDYLGNIEVPLPKNDQELDEIVEVVRAAENARQKAISKFEEAASAVNLKL